MYSLPYRPTNFKDMCQMMVDMTAEHPASSLRERLGSTSSSEISLKGWRSNLNKFDIIHHFTFFMTVLVKFQIEIRFSLNLHGNTKLSMTSNPPSSAAVSQRCAWKGHVPGITLAALETAL